MPHFLEEMFLEERIGKWKTNPTHHPYLFGKIILCFLFHKTDHCNCLYFRKEAPDTSTRSKDVCKNFSTNLTKTKLQNGICNEPVILPSRVKNMISYRSEDIQDQGLHEVDKNRRELIESAG